jgi:hypothetical protein
MPNAWIQALHNMMVRADKTIINWNSDGNGFIIYDVNKFTKNVLSNYFPHGGYRTFIRSLNWYNFSLDRTKSTKTIKVYTHSQGNFCRDHPGKINDIKRKQVTNDLQSLKKLVKKITNDIQLIKNQQINLKRPREPEPKYKEVIYDDEDTVIDDENTVIDEETNVNQESKKPLIESNINQESKNY